MDNNKLAVATYNKIAKIYTDKYFSDTADFPYIDKFLDLVPKEGKFLDAGCGPGHHVKYLLEKSYKAQGIDLSEKMIEISKEKVPNGKFEVMDMMKMDFEDETFDGLISAYSLIHIPTAEIIRVLTEFSRVLKPNGHLLLMAQEGKPDTITSEPLKSDELMFINFFTTERLNLLLRNALFNVIYTKEARTKDTGSMSENIIYTIAQKK